MKFNLLHVCTLLSVALVGSDALTPETYWKSMLPNTPMPKSIKDILYTEWSDEKSTVGVGKGSVGVHTGKPRKWTDVDTVKFGNYHKYESKLKDIPNVALFFLENDLRQGTQMNQRFLKKDRISTLLPRKIADSIPFSSNNLPQIYNKFSVKPDSVEAKIMKQTLAECENTGIQGEEKYCATSLESMVDFSTIKLGKNVKAISTEVNAKESTRLQKFRIKVAKKLAANKAVVCHKENYPYAVFYCHKFVSTQTYAVSITGADGTKVSAVAVCHMDTTEWNPKHLAFQILKVKPGTVPICHFLPEEDVVWVPYL
ncbi:hypothetical protein L1987_00141 [Smallanthus sonchifolius]|uniref:Uncharacterized protein n=1 Tax=Smallanthus sonchifolius TaxID=185202 RepID=A0ACB9K1H2_9ASTR|nr:hypothetical protein L1987_00141 [Smallanthus sonchifolius]